MVHQRSLAQLLDDATSNHRLLDHPFYRAWAAGTLTRADLAHYATQYWRQVQAFPGYLEELAERLPADARAVVLRNLADERDDDHPGLWVRFAEALGATRSDLDATEPEPETRACVGAFADAVANASPAFALGMLYGYESQTPEVAHTKVDGLRRHHGIDGEALEYFELHGELDVHHAAELADAIGEVGDVDAARAGAAAGAAAIWGLLDGVARARAIEFSGTQPSHSEGTRV